jgi:adenylosuccinate lyase
MRNSLQSISPLDGRYASKLEDVSKYFSEAALMKYRIKVEIEWLIYLCNELKLEGTKVFNKTQVDKLRETYTTFDLVDAKRVKEIEKETNHDVKAIEYLIKEKLKGSDFEEYLEFVHFACTSEDINNLSYALMLKDGLVHCVVPLVTGIVELLYEMALKHKSVAMISRTHGQTASPTTMGKEIINVVARLERQLKQLSQWPILGKINGAVGNYNAHTIAYHDIDWISAGADFVKLLGIEVNAYTTQIEPHDYNAEIFDCMVRLNTVMIDFNRDFWGYISLGYFKQKLKEGEIGSSTMPHKVNPIDFENSEGNLGMANALLAHMAQKLPVSRWQRDLTDSTTLRNMGSAIGYSVLAYINCIQGIQKLQINEDAIANDINDAWELLTEPIQTVMRKHKIANAYEKLKKLSRGKSLDKKIIQTFIESLEIPKEDKVMLKELTPAKYIGLAQELVELYKPNYKVE